jgi:general stress protein YciG
MPSGRLLAMKKKMPAAVELGRRGGFARAKKASRQKLTEIGRKGAAARWRKAGENAHHLPKA